MKKIILISAITLLLVNILFGLILSCFNGFNVALSSLVIVLAALMLYIINCIKLKDAFKVSLSLLFGLAGLLEYVISIFMPSHFTDNWGLIAIILLFVLEGIILLITNTVSTKIK